MSCSSATIGRAARRGQTLAGIVTAMTFAGVAGQAMAGCSVQSGPQTAALVELYTSEGCNSCPPADRALSGLADKFPGSTVIPMALHVDYWDYIGWRDPFAQADFGERQRWLARVGGRRQVYTPQFFAGGVEVGPSAGGLAGVIRRIQSMPARARVSLQTRQRAGGFDLDVAVSEAAAKSSILQVAILESRLVSRVSAGENRGEQFVHDRVVRQWLPPVKVVDGRATMSVPVSVKPAWQTDKLAVVAFVQDPATGQILQAVQARECLFQAGAIQADAT